MLSHRNLMGNARNMYAEGFLADPASICIARRCSIWPTWRRCMAHFLAGNTHAFIRIFSPEGVAHALRRSK